MNEVLLFNEPHIVIKYLPAKEWLVAIWRGPQTDEIVKDSLEKLLAGLKMCFCEKVLCDQSGLVGQAWLNVGDWVEHDYLPRLICSSCRYFAWVQSPDLAYQGGKERVVRMPIWNFEYLIFDDVEKAKTWLHKA